MKYTPSATTLASSSMTCSANSQISKMKGSCRREVLAKAIVDLFHRGGMFRPLLRASICHYKHSHHIKYPINMSCLSALMY